LQLKSCKMFFDFLLHPPISPPRDTSGTAPDLCLIFNKVRSVPDVSRRKTSKFRTALHTSKT
jgi:hypothetical protein